MRARGGRTEPMRLEHVVGLSSMNGSGLVGSSTGTDAFYIAGSTIVRYNHVLKTQKRFYHMTKAVSSIALSTDGRYLAAGERGHAPSIVVWDILREEKVCVLTGHKHGIGCLAFSPNGRYLVSAGFKPDKQLIIWDWDRGNKLATHKLSNKVHAINFHRSGEFFVTAGDRHLKWWHISEILEGEAISVEGRPASITEDHRLSVFTDIVCGNYNCEGKVFCITSAGVLSVFNEQRMMEKCVQIETVPCYSLELFTADGAPGLLVVGCAHGVVNAYSPLSLDLISALPLPCPLSFSNGDPPSYPACFAVRKLPGTRSDPIPKLATIYADRSLIVWDICDIYNVSVHASSLGHRSCVWDMQFVDPLATDPAAASSSSSSSLPGGSFWTCSADNSIRCWNVDAVSSSRSRSLPSISEASFSAYSEELLRVIEVTHEGGPQDEHSHLDNQSVIASTATGLSFTQQAFPHSSVAGAGAGAGGGTEFDFCAGIPDAELPDRSQSFSSPRSMALHPYGHELACGDKTGHLRVYDVASLQLIRSVQAHSAEILTVSFSPPDEEERVLCASAGRDRLIHIFHANHPHHCYHPVETLDHHSSSVILVRFTSDGKKLISCGGDKCMVLCTVQGLAVTRVKTISIPQGTINGLAVDPSNKFAITSGQDKRVNIWNVHNGKLVRGYKTPEMTAELYKCDLDPSGTYIVTCGFDKTITLIDFFSGEVLTQVSGHSELITGVKFSPDGHRVVSIGGDGCIMTWKIADLLVKAMKDRLMELYASAQKKNLRAVLRQSLQGAGGAAAQMSLALPTPPPQEASEAVQSAAAPPSSQLPPSSSLTAIKQKAGVKHGAERLSTEDNKRSKWQVDSESYELFGRKVVASHAPQVNRNKFTLELTTAPMGEKTLKPAGQADARPEDGSASSAMPMLLPPRPPSRGEGEGEGVGERLDSHASAGQLQDPDHRLARHAEDLDKVMQEVSSDEDERLFSAHHREVESSGGAGGGEDEREDADRKGKERSAEGRSWSRPAHSSEGPPRSSSPTLGGTGAVATRAADADDETIRTAQQTIHQLERSAHDLENWLEEMLKNESQLAAEPPAGAARVPSTATPAAKPDLGQSLSSAFFRGIRPPGSANEAAAPQPAAPQSAPIDEGEEPAAGVRTGAEEEEEEEEEANHRKLRESAAMMTLTRDRLRAMDAYSVLPPPPPPVATTSGAVPRPLAVQEHATGAHTETTPTFSLQPPPPPPPPAASTSHDAEERDGRERETGYDTDSTASGPYDGEDADADEQPEGEGLSPRRSREAMHDSTQCEDALASGDFLNTRTQTPAEVLHAKSRRYQRVLQDLEAAKAKAAASFQELVQLRSMLEAETTEDVSTLHLSSSAASTTGPAANHDATRQSLLETDALLEQFRRSLAGFHDLPLSWTTTVASQGHSSTSGSTSSFAGGKQSGEVLLGTATGSARSPAGTSSAATDDSALSAFLERYSDRLVEIVGEKILSKVKP